MKVLIVEDNPQRIDWFQNQLTGHEIDVTADVKVAIDWLQARAYDNIFLDHDLAEHHYAFVDLDRDEATPFDHENGRAVAKWLAEHPEVSPEAEIVIHSLNPYGARHMHETLVRAKRRSILMPFPYLRIISRNGD